MNLLFCGLGGIGQRYLRIIKKKYPKAKIYSFTKRNNNQIYEINDNLVLKKNNIYKKYNIKKITNFNNVKNRFFDASFITNPTSLHTSTCRKIYQKTKKVLIEKPLSNNLKNIDFVQKKDNIFTANVMRYHPAVNKLKEILKANQFGKLQSCFINVQSYMPDWHKYEDFRKLYASQKRLGGGVVLTESHELDLIRYFFGLPDKAISVLESNKKFQLDVESKASCCLIYVEKDLLVNVKLDFLNKNLFRCLIFIFDKGKININFNKNQITTIYLYNNKKIVKSKTYKINRNNLFKKMIVDFMGYKIKGKNNILLDSGIETLNLCLGIKKKQFANNNYAL